MMLKSIKAYFLLVSLMVVGASAFAQAPDFWQLASAKNEATTPKEFVYHHDAGLTFSYNPVRYAMRSAMYFYQQKITYQMPGTCMYAPSCSEFSRQCFEEFGMGKALFLTMDRLARCNRFEIAFRSKYDIISGQSGIRFNDPASRYHFHAHK